MRILLYSDRRSNDFLSLYEQAEVLVTTGDLFHFDFYGLEQRANKKPAFGVYGNHDSGRYFEGLGITNLHNKIIEHQGLKWGGFQGCLKYKDAESPMFTESEAKDFADNFPYIEELNQK